MRSILALALVALALGIPGCSDDTVTDAQPDEWTDDRIVMFDDRSDVQIHMDPLEIASAKVMGNTLVLEVSYGGGCKQHEFRLYGSKGFLESYPVQAMIWLSHDADGDMCEALIREQLMFNLTPLKIEYKRGYSDNGPVILRIYPPGSYQHFEPRPVYRF
jgi:hypothetical protein